MRPDRFPDLRDVVCPEAAELLAGHPVGMHACIQLRKMTPALQVRAARLMLAAGDFRGLYVETIETAYPSIARRMMKRGEPRHIQSGERQRMEAEAQPVHDAYLAVAACNHRRACSFSSPIPAQIR